MHAHALPRRRVLVVDDDPQVRDMLVLALDAEGFEVQAAEDGRRALELLAEWRPHLILLDLMMPELDGWAFRARQLAWEDASAIPVVVLSAGHNLRARVDALRAAAILPKPFSLETLLAVSRTLTASAGPAPLGCYSGSDRRRSRRRALPSKISARSGAEIFIRSTDSMVAPTPAPSNGMSVPKRTRSGPK